MQNNTQVLSSTSNIGNAGNIIFNAPTLTVTSNSQILAEANGNGAGGNITLNMSYALTLTSGVTVSASTSGSGQAGEINVNAGQFTLNQGAKLTTTTSGSGAAGGINLTIKDILSLDGSGTGLFATTAATSSGAGGNIFIDPNLVLITDRAGIFTNSLGSGVGGNISVVANRLILANQGAIAAATAVSDGGNIFLNVRDYILMRNNSSISATAGGQGNGGNVDINAGFLLAVTSENSDIIARAFRGQGGQIRINTQGIYGLEFRDPLSRFSDINASSDFGLNGTVTITTPGLDPSRGLTALPLNLVDPSKQIAQGCSTSSNIARKEGRFVVTGRGGLPETPGDLLSRQQVQVDLGTTIEIRAAQSTSTPIAIAVLEQIVEMQGWTKNDNGDVVLVAQPLSTIPHDSNLPTAACAQVLVTAD